MSIKFWAAVPHYELSILVGYLLNAFIKAVSSLILFMIFVNLLRVSEKVRLYGSCIEYLKVSHSNEAKC